MKATLLRIDLISSINANIKTETENISFKKEERKKMFYLMMHSTHFIYGYMALD